MRWCILGLIGLAATAAFAFQSPIDPGFLANAEKFSVRENGFKRTFAFTSAESGEAVKCKYSMGWTSQKSLFGSKEKSAARRVILNGFSGRRYKVRAVSHAGGGDSMLGMSGIGEYAVELINVDGEESAGTFVFDGLALKGRINEQPYVLRERTRGPNGRFLPLKNTFFPNPTSGFFCIESNGEPVAEIVLLDNRRGMNYEVFIKRDLSRRQRDDVVSMFLMLPSVRSMLAMENNGKPARDCRR